MPRRDFRSDVRQPRVSQIGIRKGFTVKTPIATVVLSLASVFAPAADVSKVSDSVAMLYGQSASGGMAMRCTATAFEKVGAITRFLTAAHCVSEVDEKTGREKLVVDP